LCSSSCNHFFGLQLVLFPIKGFVFVFLVLFFD